MSELLRSRIVPKGGGGIKSMVGSLRCFGRRFSACRRGTSSVEFVMVLAPMLLFIFGIIGFGLITYAHTNMVNAAREATRRLSVDEVEVVAANTDVTCGQQSLQDVIDAAALDDMTAAEEIACDYLGVTGISFTVKATACVPIENRDVTVLITADASDAFMVDIWGLFTGDLQAVVTMRREAVCPTP